MKATTIKTDDWVFARGMFFQVGSVTGIEGHEYIKNLDGSIIIAVKYVCKLSTSQFMKLHEVFVTLNFTAVKEPS